MKHFLVLAMALVALSLGACTKESQFPEATGKASFRAINTIPTSPPFSFLIEERPIGNAAYKNSSSPSSFDDLEYTFNFDVVLGGNQPATRVASRFLAAEAGKDYTFVISGVTAAPTVTLWEGEIREWAETDTEERIGGVTWLELFILFDTSGARTIEGRHIKDAGVGG